jgi:hypothetical protein
MSGDDAARVPIVGRGKLDALRDVVHGNVAACSRTQQGLIEAHVASCASRAPAFRPDGTFAAVGVALGSKGSAVAVLRHAHGIHLEHSRLQTVV